MSALPTATPLPAWRRYLPSDEPSRLASPLASMFDAQRPALGLGRFSGSDGPEARRLAVDDLLGGTKVLASHSGLNFTAALPTKADLLHSLETAPVHTSHTFEGKPFRNRYAVLDLRERAGLVVLLSNGSGHLLDEEGNQPFVMEAARQMRRFNAALFVCKRFDRLAREDWGAAPMMIALRQLDAYLCDEEGLGDVDLARSLTSFVKGGGSRRQADDMPGQSRDGQMNRSGNEFLQGRVAYHISTTPPPGCGVVWMKGSGTTPTDRVLFLDTPACRPAGSQVASGLPQVFDSDGNPIDQVANIRFLLSKYGREDWPAGRLVGELARRGFSTEGMRSQNVDVTATIRTDGAGHSALSTVLGHLGDYERAELHVQVGGAEEPYVIAGFIPPDGRPWADPEDFRRIRRHLRERDERMDKRAQLTFSGLKARLDGTAVRLLVTQESRARSGAPRPRRYRFVLEEDYPQHVRSAAPSLQLPPDIWAQSLVDGLMAVDGTVLLPAGWFDPEHGPDDGLGRLRGELESLGGEIAASTGRLDVLLERLEEVDHDGRPRLTGAMLARVQAEYNRLAEKTLPDLRQRHAELTLRAEELESRRPQGADASGVLWLVASLRDPTDVRFRPVWLASLRKVEFTSTSADGPDMVGRLLTWSGALELSTADQASVLVPFRGQHDTRRRRGQPEPTKVRSNLDRCLQALRAGVPFRQVDVPHRDQLLPLLRDRLGAPADRPLLLVSCDDRLLVRVTTETLLRPDEASADLAADLDVAPALIDRIRTVQREGGRGWLLDRDVVEVAMYVLASRTSEPVPAQAVADLADASLGQVYNVASRLRQETDLWTTRRKRGYVLASCDCGSTARAPIRLREVVGPVCLGCRKDLAGVVWPADRYDRYRAHAHLWDRQP